MVPELAPPEIRSVRKPTVDDLLPLVVEEGCGLRPARNGGIRLEVQWAKSARGKARIPVVHNYGWVISCVPYNNVIADFRIRGRHAGYGYISSWGSASVALNLLNGALAEREQGS